MGNNLSTRTCSDPKIDRAETLSVTDYDLICLGVGKGATAVYSNKTSSSFALQRRSTGECILLIDIGLGSIYALQQYLKTTKFQPRQIFVSHNHSDHSGELPVYIANETAKSTVRVYCFSGIQSRLRHNRCAELDSATTDLFKNVQWVPCNESESISLDSGDSRSNLTIRVQQSQHSELCAGFVLYENDHPILSFSGDSGFNAAFFDFLWTAPLILVDGRQGSTYEHASFDEILNFYKTKDPSKKVYVYHYGLDNEKPSFPVDNVSAIIPGQVVQLVLP